MREDLVRLNNVTGPHVSGILVTPQQATDQVAILCHGFLSHKNSPTNRRFTELLVPQGIATFCFDWAGMGESQQSLAQLTISTYCQQLRGVLSSLQASQYRHIGILGSSFGGLITTLVASNNPMVKVVGLKCPVADFPDVLQRQLGKKGMETWKHTDHIPSGINGSPPIHLRFAFFEDCCRYNAFVAAEHILASTMIVHGDHDDIVPLQQVQQLYEAIPVEKDFRVIAGADHYFHRQEDFHEMTASLTEWISAHFQKDS